MKWRTVAQSRNRNTLGVVPYNVHLEDLAAKLKVLAPDGVFLQLVEP
jgi:hypothetical protein